MSNNGSDINALEALIHESVSKVLEIKSDSFDNDEPFIELGLDSLAATQLLRELNIELGGELDVKGSEIFDHPTIKELANFVHSKLNT